MGSTEARPNAGAVALMAVVKELGVGAVARVLKSGEPLVRYYLQSKRMPKYATRARAFEHFQIDPASWDVPAGSGKVVDAIPQVGRRVKVRDLTVAQFVRLLGGTVMVEMDE